MNRICAQEKRLEKFPQFFHQFSSKNVLYQNKTLFFNRQIAEFGALQQTSGCWEKARCENKIADF